MKNKSRSFFVFCTLVLFFCAGPVFSQSDRLRNGLRLYGEGKWKEAAAELRRVIAEAPGIAERGEALYWIALAELSDGGYEASLRDMDELARIDPGNPRAKELPYHRGRALYYMRRYDDAVILLKAYADQTPSDTPENMARKSSAYYWIGECLFSLGRLDEAADIFSLVMNRYPQSAKYEAAAYRAALIDQKKIETQLLAIIKWSHEESLKTIEEYQRRERSYDQAIVAYQKRIAEMLKDTRLADLEDANTASGRRLSEAEARIRSLETALEEAQALIRSFQILTSRNNTSPLTNEQMIRILILKSNALELRNEIRGARRNSE
ncbi:MAG: tetratricopeptide repeat protein [Spirochaetaceae bacterium]|jgi:TolA-binding protein|nr:tetratricopeptide repeat protein [Spirochaetaceae bacterium]